MEHASQRAAAERELTADLRLAFSDAVGQNSTAGLAEKIRAALETRLGSLFTIIFVLWMMQDEDSDAPVDLRNTAGLASGNFASRRATEVSSRLARNVSDELAAGRGLGDVLTSDRAETIAITEVTGAITTAELEANGEATRRGVIDSGDDDGPVIKPRINTWFTQEDQRVCPVCGPLHLARQDVWERYFPSGPPAHPRCRCWLEWADHLDEQLLEAFDPNQPRGDDGRWIKKGDIAAAIGDPAKKAALRARVTNPQERKKLDVMLRGGKPAKAPGPKARAKEIAGKILGGAKVEAAHVQDLADNMHQLSIPELRKLRDKIGASFDGAKKKQEMVAALRNYVDRRIALNKEHEAGRPKYGPSRAPVKFRRGSGGSRKQVKNVLGDIPTQHVSSLVGATDDADVTIETNPYLPNQFTVQVKHPHYVAMRTFTRGDDGKLYITNDYFEVAEGHKGQGAGTEIFGRQVEFATALGVPKIRTHAAGAGFRRLGYESPRPGSYNGYYTWAAFGYDQPIARLQDAAGILEKFPGVETVSDVFDRPGGRQWWKEYGVSMPQATFDLTPGSRSQTMFTDYTASKKSRPNG